MNAILRALRVVHYDDLNDRLASVKATQKEYREEQRKIALDKIATLNPLQDGVKMLEIMKQLQSDLDKSYHSETVVSEFINQLK
jgi:hypothetical protein